MAKCDWCKEKEVAKRYIRFCSKECRYEERKRRENERRQEGKSCEICGTALGKAGKKLCGSEECKKEKDRRRKRLSPDGVKMVRPKKEKVVRTCENCNGPLPKYAKKFCGDECRLEQERKARREEYVAPPCDQCGEPVPFGSIRFCKESCMQTWHNEQKANRDPSEYNEKCIECGGDVEKPRVKFCSDGCKTKHGNDKKSAMRAALRPTRCKNCGGRLGKGKLRFCKKECRTEWHNRKVNETRENVKTGHLWVSLSAAVRERDEHKCLSCGTTKTRVGRQHDVHHIKPRRMFDDPNSPNYPENLVTLCEKCHKRVERGLMDCPESPGTTDRIEHVMSQIKEFVARKLTLG